MTTAEYLKKYAGKMKFCPKLRVEALSLPCGKREECRGCPQNVSAGLSREDVMRLNSEILRKAYESSGIKTVKGFCQLRGLEPSGFRMHMNGEVGISKRVAERYRRKLGVELYQWRG